MQRREVILNTAAMALSASLGALACGTTSALAQHAASVPADVAAGLVALSQDCQKKGVACVAHCEKMIASGDTSMTECLAASRDMVAVTEMLGKLATAGSIHLATAARLVVETCQACETACRTHGASHAVCQECAESCVRIVAACKPIMV